LNDPQKVDQESASGEQTEVLSLGIRYLPRAIESYQEDGSLPFDLAKVHGLLKVVQEHGTKLKGLWPDDSQTGGETKALPAVWQKKSDFLVGFDKLTADAKAAATAIKDEVSFKTEWPKVTANCGGSGR
jgi:cytochrome c556